MREPFHYYSFNVETEADKHGVSSRDRHLIGPLCRRIVLIKDVVGSIHGIAKRRDK